MNLRYNISVLLIAAMAGLSSGCIREDRSDCTCDVLLSFVYTGDGTSDIFPEKIDKVSLYVYSAGDNSLAGTYEFDKSDLTALQGAHIRLVPGDYRIVCWGNSADRTHVHTVYDGAHVAELAHLSPGLSFNGTDDLYFSDLEVTVPETLVDVSGVCEFESSHIDMYVKLRGFKNALLRAGDRHIPGNKADAGETPAAAADATVKLTHTGCPEYTDFFNSPSSDKCDVEPVIMDDPEEENSYLLVYNVLRFTESEDTDIVLTTADDGREFYRLSVPEFVDRYGIDVDGKQEARVAIIITLGPTGVDVSEWNIEDVDPGFD